MRKNTIVMTICGDCSLRPDFVDKVHNFRVKKLRGKIHESN